MPLKVWQSRASAVWQCDTKKAGVVRAHSSAALTPLLHTHSQRSARTCDKSPLRDMSTLDQSLSISGAIRCVTVYTTRTSNSWPEPSSKWEFPWFFFSFSFLSDQRYNKLRRFQASSIPLSLRIYLFQERLVRIIQCMSLILSEVSMLVFNTVVRPLSPLLQIDLCGRTQLYKGGVDRADWIRSFPDFV